MSRNPCRASGGFKKSWGFQNPVLGSGYLHSSDEHEKEEGSISGSLSACVFSDIPVSHLDEDELEIDVFQD